MSETKLKRAHGNWVDGERFWDREAELDLLIESLQATLNVLTPFELGPWDRETATGCLEALANAYELEFQDGTIDTLLDRLAIYIPHHVQMFFDNLYRTAKLRRLRSIDRKLVDSVYETKMISLQGHAELSHLEERLKMVLGPELHPLALALLTEAAVDGKLTAEAGLALARENLTDGSQGEEEVREILGILQHDGYLRKTDGGDYQFLSNLLKDWWEGHFGFGYAPWKQRKR